MNVYETILKETSCVVVRVKANSEKEAKEIFEEFMHEEPGYLSEELDLNGNKEWFWGPFDKVNNTGVWRATITKNEDGTFDAQYEGSDQHA